MDGNQQVTYVAQSNLSYDSSNQSGGAQHDQFVFFKYDQENNRYIRNNTPWNPGKPPDAPPSDSSTLYLHIRQPH